MINNQYKIKEIIGEGRSQVFSCTDNSFPGKDFAIKIFGNPDNIDELEVFRKEFYTIRKLNHPNIIKAYEYGTVLITDKKLKSHGIKKSDKFIIQDHFKGVNLAEFDKIKDEDVLRTVIAKICSVLYYLQQSNYIYHDLKPENILIKEQYGIIDIMFVDFGLARYIPEDDKATIRGTPYYIAPEILGMTKFDHRVDLYSLGILLYKIIYDRFPFEAKKELEIYKAHLEKDFEFPETAYSLELITIVKKLLLKDPAERYSNALAVLEDLKIPITKNDKLNWSPAKFFCGRRDVLSNIRSYLRKKDLQEALVIRGQEGSGKSFLLEEIASTENNTILMQSNLENKQNFWKVLLQKILFLDTIYNHISDATKQNILELIENDSGKLVDDIKVVLMEVSNQAKFKLLLDDFNTYDDFTIVILKEIIPILQVNDIKIIITEDTSDHISQKFINNIRISSLASFSEQSLNEFLDKGFFCGFPKEEVLELIKSYTDLLPGNIVGFINNLIFLNVLDFDYTGSIVKRNSNAYNTLKESQEAIYKLQYSDLTADEKKVAEFLSMFEINLDEITISILLDFPLKKTRELIESLRYKNILYPSNVSLNPRFTTQNFAMFIYNNLKTKKKKHKQAAQKINETLKIFSKQELARQFELAGLYKESYKVAKELIAEAESRAAISYKRNILEQLLHLPLEQSTIDEIRVELADTLYKLGEFKSCSDLIEDLLKADLNPVSVKTLNTQYGVCLVNLGEPLEGKKLLTSLLPEINDEEKSQFIYTQIANAELYLNNFDETIKICEQVVNNENTSRETNGIAYNLLGLVELYQKNNLDGTIKNFEKSLQMFKDSDLLSRIAGAELNLGNIYVMKGDLNEAEKHWQNSFKINKNIGNLDHEAKLLLNYGVFYYDNQDFEKAIEQYQRAENIFTSLGNKYDRGLSLLNLGESYLRICEYQDAIDSLIEARSIFQKLNDKEEEAEIIFLMGQFYYQIGDSRQLNALVEKFGRFIEKNNLVEKHTNNLKLLSQFNHFLSNKFEDVVKNIDEIIANYSQQNDRENNYYFTKAVIFNSITLIKLNNFESAFQLLYNKKFIELCNTNLIIQAERLYLLGIISQNFKHEELNPPIEYFNKSFEIVVEQSITELSWSINYSLAKFYFDRGNIGKAKNHVFMGKSILNHIKNNITNEQLRQIYISTYDRKNALESMENYSKEIE